MKNTQETVTRRQNWEALERFILSASLDCELYSVSWDALGTILDTPDRALLASWADAFALREHLGCLPTPNGLVFQATPGPVVPLSEAPFPASEVPHAV